MSPLIAAILPSIIDIAGRFIKDPDKQAQLQLEIMRLDQSGSLEKEKMALAERLAQIKVNEVEAASESLFKSGWRPAFGWMGVAVVTSEMVLRPYLPWLMEAFGFYVPPLPTIDTEMFWTLILGLLGIGGMRSYDKRK